MAPVDGRWPMTRFEFRASRIAEFRAARGWSITYLAATIGKSENSVRAIETGRKLPTLRTFLDLAEAFGVEPADLLDRAD